MTLETEEMLVKAWRSKNDHHRMEVFGIITPRDNGEFTLNCYAIKETKRYGLQMTEVTRAWSDRLYYQPKNIWKGGLGGFQKMVEFDEERGKKHLSGGWYCGRWGDAVFWGRKDQWFIPYTCYINLDALAETKYKYCAFDQYKGDLSLVPYCRLFKSHKEVELLAKNRLHSFISETFLDRMARDKGLAAFFRSHIGELRHYTINEVTRAYKHGWTLAKALKANRISAEMRGAPKGVDKFALKRYLTKNDVAFWDYKHYAETVAQAGEDILSFGNTFPRDFHAHEKKMQRKAKRALALKRRQEREALERQDREREEALKLIAARLNGILDRMSKRLAWRVGDYTVVIPATQKQFIAEGNAMRNCIGGYYEQCAAGDAICFFIRKDGKRLADVEADPKSGKLRQCRAKCNKAVDDETRAFAASVAKELVEKMRKVA